jgi:hypothetical protein
MRARKVSYRPVSVPAVAAGTHETSLGLRACFAGGTPLVRSGERTFAHSGVPQRLARRAAGRTRRSVTAAEHFE